MEKDLKISELKHMQLELYEKNKERWNDMNPDAARNHLLYMVEEMGECISIIKKKGISQVMENPVVRAHFTEEISDVLMYYVEVLNRLEISAQELSEAYVSKYNTNMKRNYVEENKKKWE